MVTLKTAAAHYNMVHMQDKYDCAAACQRMVVTPGAEKTQLKPEKIIRNAKDTQIWLMTTTRSVKTHCIVKIAVSSRSCVKLQSNRGGGKQQQQQRQLLLVCKYMDYKYTQNLVMHKNYPHTPSAETHNNSSDAWCSVTVDFTTALNSTLHALGHGCPLVTNAGGGERSKKYASRALDHPYVSK